MGVEPPTWIPPRDVEWVDQIVAFITARLDEDEQDARVAAGLPHDGPQARWTASWIPGANAEVGWQIGRCGGSQRMWPVASALRAPVAIHAARQDPAATLARVAALRSIVHECADHAVRPGTAAANLAMRTLISLASAREDHPDFDLAWVL
jgi:hypothetical protein